MAMAVARYWPALEAILTSGQQICCFLRVGVYMARNSGFSTSV